MPQTREEKAATYRAWCAANREKVRAYARQYRIDNPDRHAEYEKKKTARKLAWRKANPEAQALIKRRENLRQTYGLTPEQVDDMVEAQGFLCATCGTDVREDPCVDHCHDTNRVRGILCRRCNLALGLALDNPTTLRAMAEYLERQNPSDTFVKP